MSAGARGWGGGHGSNPHIDLYISISITDSQGKNYTENRPGEGSAVHTSAAL